MHTQAPPAITKLLTPNVQDLFVCGVQDLYDNLPTDADIPGLDSHLTGQHIYRLSRHYLEVHARRLTLLLEVQTPNNALLFRVGELTFTCQRVAATHRHIWDSFPNSYKAGVRQTGNFHSGQGTFDFADADYDLDPPLVLAHMGSLQHGLISIHLCRPAIVEDGKIFSWEFAHELFNADIERTPTLTRESIPPVEHIEAPLVLPLHPDKSTTES